MAQMAQWGVCPVNLQSPDAGNAPVVSISPVPVGGIFVVCGGRGFVLLERSYAEDEKV